MTIYLLRAADSLSISPTPSQTRPNNDNDDDDDHRGYCTVLACMLNGKKRAVKIPLANCSDPEGAVADLTNEIRILKRLRHPHLCSVYGAGGWRTEGELPFLVLERLQYQNLAQQVHIGGHFAMGYRCCCWWWHIWGVLRCSSYCDGWRWNCCVRGSQGCVTKGGGCVVKSRAVGCLVLSRCVLFSTVFPDELFQRQRAKEWGGGLWRGGGVEMNEREKKSTERGC